jgi:hypothetical protein
MANLALIVLVVLLVWYAVSFVRRRRRGLVAQRGISIGADLGTMADMPRVRVREVTRKDAERVRLVLTPDSPNDDDERLPATTDLDLVVCLTEDELGAELLQKWKRSEAVLAIVRPPDSRIVRLRSFDDLQPLTLRIDEG